MVKESAPANETLIRDSSPGEFLESSVLGSVQGYSYAIVRKEGKTILSLKKHELNLSRALVIS